MLAILSTETQHDSTVDPVFTKISPKHYFSLMENKPFGLVFRENWVCKVGQWSVDQHAGGDSVLCIYYLLHCKSGSFEKYLNQLYSTDQIAMVWFCENQH